MNTQIFISSAPHIKTARATKNIMLDVLVALLPATGASILFFGYEAAILIAISLASAFCSELAFYIALKKPLSQFFTQFDYTSLVTGLLLALCLPANLQAWYAFPLGNLFAVGVVKMLFGGTGKNVINPALGGRIFLFISFSVLTVYPSAKITALLPHTGVMTGASSLDSLLKGEGTLSLLDLFLGTGVAGCMGETSKLALLLGGVYLCLRGVIQWYLPLLTLLSCGLFTACLQGFDFTAFLPSILSGGVILGAIYMATDYVTSPKTRLGNIVYFFLLGLLTAGLRKATGTEVSSFCILLMNFLVFFIDKFTPARPFGARKKEKTA